MKAAHTAFRGAGNGWGDWGNDDKDQWRATVHAVFQCATSPRQESVRGGMPFWMCCFSREHTEEVAESRTILQSASELSQENWFRRWHAVTSIPTEFVPGDDRAISRAIDGTKDQDAMVRCAALKALAQITAPDDERRIAAATACKADSIVFVREDSIMMSFEGVSA